MNLRTCICSKAVVFLRGAVWPVPFISALHIPIE